MCKHYLASFIHICICRSTPRRYMPVFARILCGCQLYYRGNSSDLPISTFASVVLLQMQHFFSTLTTDMLTHTRGCLSWFISNLFHEKPDIGCLCEIWLWVIFIFSKKCSSWQNTKPSREYMALISPGLHNNCMSKYK